ncbi:DNA primase TraC [compost metagenome]
MKGLTDFNDLAHRSALGQDGLDRQVRSAVQDAIEKRRLQSAVPAEALRPEPVQRAAGLRMG